MSVPLTSQQKAQLRMELFDALPVVARDLLTEKDLPLGNGMIAELAWAVRQSQPSRLGSAMGILLADWPTSHQTSMIDNRRLAELDCELVFEFRQAWYEAGAGAKQRLLAEVDEREG